MKKLPLSYSDQLNGECWTFYKFAILKAHPIAVSWLATHIEFYINENMCGGYGDADCDYYRMRYYGDILSMTRIPVSKVSDNDLIDTICREIDKEHYIVIYLNYNRIYGMEDTSLHELLIYGYDMKKKTFCCPFLIEGSFKEVEISFDTIKLAYDDVRKLYMQDGWRLLVKRNYYFGITSVSLRSDYCNDNYIADYLNKIDHEIHGKQIIQKDLSDENPTKRICYTGNACLLGLADFIKNVAQEKLINENVLWRLIRTLKMMRDYRTLFLLSMNWFAETIGGRDDTILVASKKEYKLCANEIEHCYLRLCKYMLTKDIQLLYKTSSALEDVQRRELDILLSYREQIFPYYYNINGVPMPEE